MMHNCELRLAQGIATAGCATAAVGTNYGWNHQGVEEEYGSSEDE
jgi:hypothetical protein